MPLTRRSAAVLLALVFSALSPAPLRAQAAFTTKVTFLLVNDIYLMGDQVTPDGKRRGGFARVAAIVKAERAKGGHVVLAHGGDTLSPSLMSGLDRGQHIMTLTNMVPPDVFVPGNHEFDFGKAIFFKRMAEAKFPLFAANLRGPEGEPLPGFQDRAILTFDGVRIGLTGATLDQTPQLSTPEDLKFAPTVATATAQAAALRQDGADFVVAVVHADREQDIALYGSPAINLTLTGHDHDLFINYDGRAAVVESGYDGHYVTAVDAEITVTERDGRRVMVWSPQFRVLDTATVEPDPEVAAVVARFEAELAREMDVPLGTTAVELDSRNAAVRLREAAIGDLFTDAMRVSTRSDAAVINGGGIRAGKVYPAGSAITRRDILAELPFNNRIVVVEMTGRELRHAIENGLAALPNAAGRFPQVSGMRVEYDPSRPPGERVLAMSVGGAPLVEGKRYRVAVLDFLARGSDGYTMFREATRITPDNDAPLLANAVMAYIRQLGEVRVDVGERLVAK